MSCVQKMQDTKYSIKYPLLNMAEGAPWYGVTSRPGVGHLVLIAGNMDRFTYCSILKKYVLPHAKQKLRRNCQFLQDKDHKHTSHYFSRFFKEKDGEYEKGPSLRPDLNPIEHI